MKPIIYLDNNATTPLDPEVLECMMPFLKDNFANANSTHMFGLDVQKAVDKARLQVSQLIGAEPNEIVFTSGATESINIALKGLTETLEPKHIITVKTEHKAVLDTCKFLESKGVEVTYLSVQSDGLIDIQEYKNSFRPNTYLACIMYVNNETGVLQRLKELAEIAHEKGAYFMTDGTQAVGKFNFTVDDLGIDLMSFSGHKFYGPKGIGALFMRKRLNKVKLLPFLHGGGHEFGIRSGTLNVPGIIGLGACCEIANRDMAKNISHILALKTNLESELLKIDGTYINGNIHERLYNISNIRFDNVDSDAIIMGLSNPYSEDSIIAVSNGSACTSREITPSHVLLALGLDDNASFSSIRFSIGKFNTSAEIAITLNTITKLIPDLRAMRN